ncbi:MAG: hypothetical protein Q7S57_01165 [bacterium]|nr:hypothetical protein [bacterium]
MNRELKINKIEAAGGYLYTVTKLSFEEGVIKETIKDMIEQKLFVDKQGVLAGELFFSKIIVI